MTFLRTTMSSTSCHMLKFKNEYNLYYFQYLSNLTNRSKSVIHENFNHLKLCCCSIKIFSRMRDFKITISPEIISQESQTKHVRHNESCIWKQCNFFRCEYIRHSCSISIQNCIISICINLDGVEIKITMIDSSSNRPDHITKIGENISRHDCIQVNRSDNLRCSCLEEDIIHFCIMMIYPLRNRFHRPGIQINDPTIGKSKIHE